MNVLETQRCKRLEEEKMEARIQCLHSIRCDLYINLLFNLFPSNKYSKKQTFDVYWLDIHKIID